MTDTKSFTMTDIAWALKMGSMYYIVLVCGRRVFILEEDLPERNALALDDFVRLGGEGDAQKT